MNEYEKQALEFLESTDTSLTLEYLRTGKYFDGDHEGRDIWQFTLKRGRKSYSATFGNSINDSQERPPKTPSNYDILSCLNVCYAETFDDFCGEYGYSNDSISALKTWKAVQKQSEGLKRLFNETEIEELNNIG